MVAYVDNEVDRVEIFYNGYVSPITQIVRRETLLPLQQATARPAMRTRSERADGTSGPRAPSTSSPTPRRSCAGWSPTTLRSRSTGRCLSQPRPSTAPG